MAIVPTYERQTKSGRGKNIIGVDLPLYQYTQEKKGVAHKFQKFNNDSDLVLQFQFCWLKKTKKEYG